MVAFRSKWFGDLHGVWAYGWPKKWEAFLLCTGTTANTKVLHQKHFTLMGSKHMDISRNRGILWWHSVTNGLGDPHGVWAYGCPKKWEDFLLCTGTTAKIEKLHQKPFILMPTRTFPGTYSIELFPGTYGYIKKSEGFSVFSRATAKMKVLHQKLFILISTRTC